jgi:hypothetical protein
MIKAPAKTILKIALQINLPDWLIFIPILFREGEWTDKPVHLHHHQYLCYICTENKIF